MIEETITFRFKDEEQQQLFREILDGETNAVEEVKRLRDLLFELVFHIDGIIQTSEGVKINADTGALLRTPEGLVPWSELTSSCWLGSLNRAREASRDKDTFSPDDEESGSSLRAR